jgi:hypothetical protein
MITLLVFFVITYFTKQFESASDGEDKLGFPLMFYYNFSGKSSLPNAYSENGFHFIPFLMDLLIMAVISFISTIIFTKIFFKNDK